MASLPTIICFGDSLTAGYQSPTYDAPTPGETPYGAYLQRRLGPAARVTVTGICGELTGEMVLRFRKDVIAPHPRTVIILGGTNDLGWNAAPKEILCNLIKMFESARYAGIQPVSFTVPSLRVTGEAESPDALAWVQSHIDHRRQLNHALSEYCASKDIPCLDLFTATADPATGLLAEPYSNDGLHLTTEGYTLMADLLYHQVFAPQFGQAPPTSS
jgi:lysophospholipase L1-like esterase